MKILLISQFYPPIIGGEERHVRNLAAALVRRGHRVDVATLWIPGASEYETDGSVRIHRIRGTLQRIPGLFTENQRRFAPPFPDPELVAGLNRVVSQVKPDVVHAHNWILASFLPIKLWNRVRLVVTLHDYSLVCAKKVYLNGGKVCEGPALRKCLSCASDYYGSALKAGVVTVAGYGTGFLAHRLVNKFIAVSHAVARFNRLAEAGVQFEVIPNFVPDDIDTPAVEIDPCVEQLPDRFIMFAGDLMRGKGIDVLLHAYAGLNAAPPLVLIGRRTAETPNDFPPNVYQFESWSHPAVMHAWRRSLFAVVPSTVPDSCPTVVMEAMASGKAVIGSDVGGIPDLIDHQHTGYLVPPGDPVKLGSAIQLLLTNPDMRERLETAGLARVASLKASPIVSRIEQVYAA